MRSNIVGVRFNFSSFGHPVVRRPWIFSFFLAPLTASIVGDDYYCYCCYDNGNALSAGDGIMSCKHKVKKGF